MDKQVRNEPSANLCCAPLVSQDRELVRQATVTLLPFFTEKHFPNPAVFDFFDLIFYINSYIYLSFIFLKRIYSQIHMIHFSFFNTKPSKTQNPIFIYKVHKCQLLLRKPSSRSVTYLLAHAY